MNTVRLEPTNLILVGTQDTYQASGDGVSDHEESHFSGGGGGGGGTKWGGGGWSKAENVLWGGGGGGLRTNIERACSLQNLNCLVFFRLYVGTTGSP